MRDGLETRQQRASCPGTQFRSNSSVARLTGGHAVPAVAAISAVSCRQIDQPETDNHSSAAARNATAPLNVGSSAEAAAR